MSNTKDIEIEGKVRIIKDDYATYGKWENNKKLFSATIDYEFDNCLKFVEQFPLMKMHYNYIINSQKYEDYQEKVLQEQKKEKEKKKLASKPKKEKPKKEKHQKENPKKHAVLLEK